MRLALPHLFRPSKFRAVVATSIALTSLGVPGLALAPATAQGFLPYCQQTTQGIAEKEAARKAALSGDQAAQQRYQEIVAKQAKQLQDCRRQNWLKTQGLWIRLYACDIQPGQLEEVLDRIVDRGYNQIYVETFYNGQVLLPKSQNTTAWPSVVDTPGAENIDLLARTIEKGRERGLSVYAWMFALNFGASYASQPSKQYSLLRNGRGQTSLNANTIAGLSTDLGQFNPKEAFIDPYSLPAKRDYYRMVQEVLKRRPDGILFDYIRYPRSRGTASISAQLSDLWVFGEASRQALLDRSTNQKGRELIKRYLERGSVSVGDVSTIDRLFPQEGVPMWQGRTPNLNENRTSVAQRHAVLRQDLWKLAAAHARQGVVDFLNAAIYPAQQLGIPSGAVFFPEGNQVIGQGFDSRMQAWDRFPSSIQFHPMSYGVCNRTDCVVQQVQRVVTYAPQGAGVRPVLAGIWQQSISNRPPLEVQMDAIRQVAPQINAISHFAYSWQEPKSDNDRNVCRNRRF